jgi:hypothetical protein
MTRFLLGVMIMCFGLNSVAGEITTEEALVVGTSAGILTALGVATTLESSNDFGVVVTDKKLASQLSDIDKVILAHRKVTSTARTRVLIEEALDVRNFIIDEAEVKGHVAVIRLEAIQSQEDALKAHRQSQLKQGRYLIQLGDGKSGNRAIATIRYNTRTGTGVGRATAGRAFIKGAGITAGLGIVLSYATDLSLSEDTRPSTTSAEDVISITSTAGQ